MKIILYVIQFLVCAGLIGAVLLQPGKSAGLSGAITGGAEQLLGKKKSKGIEALAAKATTILAITFMVLCIVLLYMQ